MKVGQIFGLSLFCAFVILGVEPGKIHKQVRRSVLSLPQGSSLTVTMDLIVPVVPLLNTTLTYLWFDLPLTFDVPTAESLNELYVSLGLAANTSSTDGEEESSRILTDFHHNFIEDQRANHDRKQVYQYAEGFFQKYLFYTNDSNNANLHFLNSFGLDGQACVKRAICELAETPLSSHGLFGKIFELLFL